MKSFSLCERMTDRYRYENENKRNLPAVPLRDTRATNLKSIIYPGN